MVFERGNACDLHSISPTRVKYENPDDDYDDRKGYYNLSFKYYL
jgi:hypothetical protein